MTRCMVLVLAVALVLVPLNAYAGANEKQNVRMGSSALVQDNREFGYQRSHKDIKPKLDRTRSLDPNKTSKGAMSAADMRDLFGGVNRLLDALKNQKTSPDGLDKAWAGLSANAKAYLRDVGVDDSNWKQLITFVSILPRRIHGIQAVDNSRGGAGSIVYEVQNRQFTERYIDQEPVIAPAGCGCQGGYVVGYRDVERTRVVDRPTTVAVAKRIPVNETVAVVTPFDTVRRWTTQRLVTETYYESVPVIAPAGCGCQGGYVVGYRDEARTRSTWVTDQHSEPVVTFQTHLAEKFKGKGNPNYDQTIQTYLQEGSFKLLGGNMAEIKTNDGGQEYASPLDPNAKARELAGSGKAGDLAGAGAPITR
jgi:hypothetical protein